MTKIKAIKVLGFIIGIQLMIGPLLYVFAGSANAKNISGNTKHFEGSLFRISENELFSIEMVIKEKELKAGINTVDLIIHDKNDSDVSGAELTVVPWMPEMGHGVSEKPVVTEKGNGLYSVNNIVLIMTGRWDLKITVKKDTVKDTAVFNFPEIKAREAATSATDEEYRKILKPLPAMSPIPADNPMTPENIKLGKMLFWDRRVSKTGATSCGFCHHPAYYGAEPMRKSVGINGEIHLRNSPTVLNAAFLNAQFWAGESPTLEHQALSAVKSHVAMRSWPKEVAERLNRIPEYKKLSIQVFGEHLTEENIGKAMAAYMRTLVTPDYPLAKWLQGDDSALTDHQKRGMALFINKGCIGCHHGPVFSGPMHDPDIKVHAMEHPDAKGMGIHLHKVILPGAENDLGKAKTTKKEEDKYFFKVPQLLNVAKTPPYTHAGLIDNLPDMISFMAKDMLNAELTSTEVFDLMQFLHSLTGEIPQDFMVLPILPSGGGEGDFGPELMPSGKN